MEKLSKLLQTTVPSFMKEVNEFGTPVCEILHAPSIGLPIKFELVHQTNVLLQSSFLIPSMEYYTIIEKLGLKYFKCKPTFNIKGTTFWFMIGNI